MHILYITTLCAIFNCVAALLSYNLCGVQPTNTCKNTNFGWNTATTIIIIHITQDHKQYNYKSDLSLYRLKSNKIERVKLNRTYNT